MGAAERRATIDGGPTLAYAEQGPDAPIAAVFLPGWPDPWRSFELVMDRLPGEVRALALSHRGCGDSDQPTAGYGPRDLAADTVAFMDVTGVRSAVLVGRSLGAFVAQRVAIDHPERIRGLVLIRTFSTLRGTSAGRRHRASHRRDPGSDRPGVRPADHRELGGRRRSRRLRRDDDR